ncbi:hypothetical protein ACP26L_23235 [Paenibacillus sp. S-38]|uniref:hypothetical protein n=1 Tax=Paenibacillus sp. S-38 TaxID=3416710 RepID=UPI003CEA8404
MHHAVPYLLLSTVDLLLLLLVWLRTRQPWMFLLLLAFTGMVFMFEYVIMVLLDSYTYLPRVLPHRPYQDNVIGAIISNLFTIPTLGVLVVMLRLQRPAVFCIILATCSVEWLFTRLGVYELHWWRIPYTLAALAFFFYLIRIGVAQLQKGSRPLAFLMLFLASFALAATMMFVLSVTGTRLFQAGVFADPYHDDVMLATLDALVKAAVLAGVIYSTRSLLWRGAALPVFWGLQQWLVHTGRLILFLSPPVYWVLYLLCCLGVLALASLIDRKIKYFAGLV